MLGREALVQLSAASGEAVSQEFPASPLDRPTRLLSAAVVVALVGLALSIPGSAGPLGIAAGAGLPLVLLLATYGMSPKGYAVTEGSLLIRRRWFGSRQMSVATADVAPPEMGLGGFRLAASGGLFGWFGSFWRRDTGKYRAYVTDRENLVACRGDEGLILVSPVDPQAFISAVGAT